jgi:glycosyltransferase involved in cell wall biosynthesis
LIEPSLVSVVIPVFNGTNYLRQAIDSVLAQTYPYFELIVVDDGSNDGTWELIRSYGDAVRGYSKANGGVASALNHGLREMRGRWFAWLSHDDVWMPDKLALQVSYMADNPRFKASYTDFVLMDTDGKDFREIRTPWYPRTEALRALFENVYISGSTVLVEKTCFDALGSFSEQHRMTQDLEMWSRILMQFEFGRVPKALVGQRVHCAQDSAKVDVFEKEKQATFDTLFGRCRASDLFPEKTTELSENELAGFAEIWFADTMARCRGYYTLAAAHYRRAAVLAKPFRVGLWRKLTVNEARRLLLSVRISLRSLVTAIRRAMRAA